MLLSIGTVGYLRLEFEHTHEGRRHRHPLELADAEAHWLAHRLEH